MTDKAYNDMSAAELQQELLALTREQFNLRIQKMTSENVKSHQFKQTRRAIARVKTAMAAQRRSQQA
jgi:large subunit ribosomal protein L29